MMYSPRRDNIFVCSYTWEGFTLYNMHLNRVSLLNEKYVNHSDVDNAYTINFIMCVTSLT